jgi:hypothetical protein
MHSGHRRKARRKETTRKTRGRREDNFEVYLREIGWVVWTELIWFRIQTSGGLL